MLLTVVEYILVYLVSAAMVILPLLACASLVAEHRACKRRLAVTLPAAPPVTGTSQRNGCCGGLADRGHTTTCPDHGIWMETTPARPTLDPDIAWALADDPDPVAVRALLAELAVPLADLVAEGERRAIAERYPLKGSPAEARVVDPPLTKEQAEVLRKRLLESTRQVMVLPQDSTTYIPFGGNNTTYHHPIGRSFSGGGGGSTTNSIMGPPDPQGWEHPLDAAGRRRLEPETLRKLRERRTLIYEAAQHLTSVACAAARPFNDAESREWGALMNQLAVMDRRIAVILEVMHRP